jgi:transposase-like protein
MKSQRRAFTPEFKDEAVKLVVNTGGVKSLLHIDLCGVCFLRSCS